MSHITLANATDLDQWAKSRASQDQFPKLIRRLVAATANGLKFIHFPAGEGVQQGGWDGIVEAEGNNAFIPAGFSGWELSCNSGSQGKAQDDYEKRNEDPLGLDPSQTIFVYATPRRWSRGQDWCSAKQTEGIWREVRAYDADMLETWLESAPAVHLWLSRLLGKSIPGMEDVESYWEGWSESTRPALPATFLLAGRDEGKKAVEDWLSEAGATVFGIQSENRKEAAAFFAAVVQQLPDELRHKVLASAVVVYTQEAWDHLSASTSPLLIVPLFDVSESMTRATKNGHRVIVPSDALGAHLKRSCLLPRLSREGIKEVLISAGFEHDAAYQLAGLARRSIMSFRRKLAADGSVKAPEWAKPQQARDLLPAMLAGTWNEAKEGDCKVLSELAQEPYESYKQRLQPWTLCDDPPVRFVGGVWYVVSREDIWRNLSLIITKEDLDRITSAVNEVLGTPLPKYELPDDKHFMADILGYEAPHSSHLRKGLADSLAIMGARSSDLPVFRGVTIGHYAERIVRDLLAKAASDWKTWASLQNMLECLAEAAPEELLLALESSLQGDPPVLSDLFRDQNGDWFISPSHTGLLWALETMAWSEDLLPRVVLILARLCLIDPGGQWANRPSASLRTIFLPWLHQTSASVDSRLGAIDLIRERVPSASWALLKSLLPKNHDIGNYNQKPKWREWALDARRPTRGDSWTVITGVLLRMLQDVGTDGEKWCDLIEAMHILPDGQFDQIVAQLSNLDSSTLPEMDKSAIWHKLREEISRHISFPDADWSMPQNRIIRLADLHPKFEPAGYIEKFAWLFDSHPDLLEGNQRGTQDKYNRKIDLLRKQAIEAILGQEGLGGLLNISESVKDIVALGRVAGELDALNSFTDTLVLNYLGSENRGHSIFAWTFLDSLICRRGRDWAESRLKEMDGQLCSELKALFLRSMPCDERTWDLAEQLGANTKGFYWRAINAVMLFRAHEPGVIDRPIAELLKHGQVSEAVKFITLVNHENTQVSAELIASALEMLVQDQSQVKSRIDAYDIRELLELLSKAKDFDTDRLAGLEWAFLPIFRLEETPNTLNNSLASRPVFFVDVVSTAFKARNEDHIELDEHGHQMATRAYQLIDDWQYPLKTNLDPTALKQWVTAAREGLKAKDREAIGDQRIGQALSSQMLGSDGAWPCEAVREVIETFSSEEIERGLVVGVLRGRGVTSRWVLEGGRQERELAAQYESHAKTLGGQWPRTQALLRTIARSYKDQALWEDQEAELDEDLMR
ncbi:MAG: hypothetical protein V1806_01870 [Pseudomonadota bacterium]